jgi:hypothetical protein
MLTKFVLVPSRLPSNTRQNPGIVKGKLSILPDLPPYLRQGIFAEPGKTYVTARYVNEPVFLQPDQAPGPRGLSMKVLGMHGGLLKNGDKSAPTQGFFFNNAPMIELTDIDTCLEIMKLRGRHFDDPAMLKTKTAPILLPNTNLVSMNFYTQSVLKFGELHGHTTLC